jgi:nicotinate-nucleotide adenylyltransferase
MIRTARSILASHEMKESRRRHSESTAVLAANLFLREGGASNETAAFASGLLHDVAKELDHAVLLELAAADGFSLSRGETARPGLLHGRAAAMIAKRNGIDDERILDAVRWHVTGHTGMDAVALCLFVADYCEPLRTHVSGDERDRLLRLPLRRAAREILALKIAYVRAGGLEVESTAVDALKELSTNGGLPSPDPSGAQGTQT